MIQLIFSIKVSTPLYKYYSPSKDFAMYSATGPKKLC